MTNIADIVNMEPISAPPTGAANSSGSASATDGGGTDRGHGVFPHSWFEGRTIPSELRRTFGGQVAAQSFAAAMHTVEGKIPHSLHGYFVAAAKSALPLHFDVENLRDGRSFSHRRVTAMQEGKPVFMAMVGFQTPGGEGPEHQDLMPEVPSPVEIRHMDEAVPPSARALLQEWENWEIRVVPSDSYEHDPRTPSQQMVWMRSKEPVVGDELVHYPALVYISDMTLLYSALVNHQGHEVQMASLDHSVWFYREPKVDEWLLYDQSSPAAGDGRSLTTGRFFDVAGNLVAVVSQEGLTRSLRPGATTLPMDSLKPKK
ncbi:acyl-CoA thioesterase II [Corynebacterium incognita]|uniref:Acyl-CoA thioesterase II n=1 Tax=Corynebacterium incognita TaxID=2754725 RepID=A0A7G7CPZ8_9CORY|nr:acyl-CoA thioesterase II [Corynebacterium incognita]QNE89664.1 acyl-CoA thioesterase II [Corynebacterium incognita]